MFASKSHFNLFLVDLGAQGFSQALLNALKRRILEPQGSPKQGSKSIETHPTSIKKLLFAWKSHFNRCWMDLGAQGSSHAFLNALKREEN